MWPYWVLFLVPAWMAVTQAKPYNVRPTSSRWGARWQLMFIFLVCMIGLRYEVGGDWVIYIENMEEMCNVSFRAMFLSGDPRFLKGDPAYNLLSWIGGNFFGGIYLPNLACAALFSWGLITFCKAQPRPWLALVVAIPYLVTMVAMGYTRQAAALGITMVGLLALQQGQVRRFVVLIALAMTFHKSAVILLPMALFIGRRIRLIPLAGLITAGAMLFILLVQDRLAFLVYGYIEQAYASSGTAVRIAMNAFPASLFLLYRRRFSLPMQPRRLWSAMSLAAIGFVVLLWLSPSSTAVDRLALYWIPLQLFVLSRLPDAMSKSPFGRRCWVWGVVIYSAIVFFVWLFMSRFSSAWLPYRFYLWEWMWGG